MKQILIGCCDECPYNDFICYHTTAGVDIEVDVCTLESDENIYIEREIPDSLEIPDWCPLDNFMR
jgi:hypothetical protein